MTLARTLRRLSAPFAAPLAALALAACAAPEPPAPTVATLTLTGAADMNGGLPAQAKVYYLRSAAAFETADFFALFDAPEATLAADLVAVESHLLAPGRTLTETRGFDAAAGPVALGVVAAFRDISGPGWKASIPLSPGAATAAAATLGASSVALVPSAPKE